MYESCSFSTSLPSHIYGQFVVVHLFYFAILVGMGWYVVVILICISRMSSIPLCAYWSFIYLLWRNVCSGPLPILKLGYLSFLLLRCKSSLCFWIQSLIRFANIFFFMSCLCLLTFLMVPFEVSSPFAFNFCFYLLIAYTFCFCLW